MTYADSWFPSGPRHFAEGQETHHHDYEVEAAPALCAVEELEDQSVDI